jgi:deoxycytidylate deaminase
MAITERLSGFENCCEDEEGLTRWDVLHAANAILKVVRSTQSCEGATLYITLSPKECSKLIHQSDKELCIIKVIVIILEFNFIKSGRLLSISRR